MNSNNKCWKPAHCSQCIPGFVVKNMKESVEFYTKALNFVLLDDGSKDEQGELQHALMNYDGCTIMFYPEGAFESRNQSPATTKLAPAMSLYIYVPNVDQAYEQAIANGAHSALAPNDSPWGDRFCTIIDPSGYEWMLATVMCNHQH